MIHSTIFPPHWLSAVRKNTPNGSFQGKGSRQPRESVRPGVEKISSPVSPAIFSGTMQGGPLFI